MQFIKYFGVVVLVGATAAAPVQSTDRTGSDVGTPVSASLISNNDTLVNNASTTNAAAGNQTVVALDMFDDGHYPENKLVPYWFLPECHRTCWDKNYWKADFIKDGK
ncbi:hypothetical protein F5Y19DRAFT_475158 [Xylariaceae sp. FL1651]|nr:hypothetical protein F5Y19DRAFT_475158 [Xylariaceae sp. FL1651]